MTIYRAQIATEAARREGRQPSHDGEYLVLYWAEGRDEWLLQGNAGVVASFAENLVETVAWRAESDDEIAEAEEIQAEIDALVAAPGEELATGPMGHEARNLARRLGWPINADGAYEEGAA